MTLREANVSDWDQIWPIFHEVVSAGETYAYAPDTSKEEGKKYWMDIPGKTFVYEEQGAILGTYYLKPNQPGPGRHVCNCGYMVAPSARGKGIATVLCEHSQQNAIEMGYKAMQFNFVVSTNEVAVRLWNRLGYHIAGRLPGAFQHPTKGYVDALVMYKWLAA